MKQILLLLVIIIFIFLSIELTLHLSSDILVVANKVTNSEFVQPEKQKELKLIKFFKDINKFVEQKSVSLIKKCHI